LIELLDLDNIYLSFFCCLDYTDVVTLNDIPFNHLVSYRVSVYTDKWSDFSESVTLDTRISINLTIQRIGFTSVRLIWNRNNSNAVLSRFLIRMKYNYSPEKEFLPIENSYETCKAFFY
jgi:hypothetical protein